MKITLAPLPWNWSTARQRDYYLRVADEADIDAVCLGQLLCNKRPFAPEGVIARLEAAEKRVILSTSILPRTPDDRADVRRIAAIRDHLVEANDMTAVALLKHRPHALGPFITICNEDSLRILAANGATSACLSFDLPGKTIARLAKASPIPLECQVFGHAPLAISARCFAARTAGRTRDNCGMACARNGGKPVAVNTLENAPFLLMNGPQVMSQRCTNLLREIPRLTEMGITSLRIQPENDIDPAELASLIRQAADGRMSPDEAWTASERLAPELVFCNGFFHNHPGHENVKP